MAKKKKAKDPYEGEKVWRVVHKSCLFSYIYESYWNGKTEQEVIDYLVNVTGMLREQIKSVEYYSDYNGEPLPLGGMIDTGVKNLR